MGILTILYKDMLKGGTQMIKKDCFAYVNKNGHQGCRALNDLYCKKEKCKFYKRKCAISLKEIEEAIKNYAK